MNEKLFQSAYSNPSISDNQYKRIAESHGRVEFKKGDYLLKNGMIANDFYLIESGLIRKYVIDTEGNEVTTRFHGKNDFSIVVISFFHRIPPVENVIAVTDVVGWKISFDAFQLLFTMMDGLRDWGRNWLSGQLFTAEQRALDVLTKSATDRYIDLLNNNPEIIHQASLKNIASRKGGFR